MRIVAKTDIGLKRTSNEDSYAAGELPGSVAWAVVCDGMGGATGGNIASSTAVKLISERISSGYHKGMTSNSIRNILISAITAANISVFDASRENPELTGMGTTVVAAILVDGVACIALIVICSRPNGKVETISLGFLGSCCNCINATDTALSD